MTNKHNEVTSFYANFVTNNFLTTVGIRYDSKKAESICSCEEVFTMTTPLSLRIRYASLII